MVIHMHDLVANLMLLRTSILALSAQHYRRDGETDLSLPVLRPAGAAPLLPPAGPLENANSLEKDMSALDAAKLGP